MWACISGRWLATLRTFVYFWLGIGFAVGIILIVVIALGGEVALGALLGLAAVMLTALLAFMIVDLITCLTSPASPPPPPPPLPGGLTAEVDCATAQDWLADARAEAARLQAELDAQIARLAAAQQALNAARMMLTAAAAALAASFFAPWSIPAAAAALAAATYMTYRSAKNLEAELARLESLADRFGAAQREIAADEMLVAQSCAIPASPPVIPSGSGIGLTAGAIPLIARGRGRCRFAAGSSTAASTMD